MPTPATLGLSGSKYVGPIAGRRRSLRHRSKQQPIPNNNTLTSDVIKNLVKTIHRLSASSTPDETMILRNMLDQVEPELRQTNHPIPHKYKPVHQSEIPPQHINRVGRTHHGQVKSRHTTQDRSHFKRIGSNQ